MYLNKFSSGTILALLALSGMLFLVPLAAPVHATNTNPLVISYQAGDDTNGPLTGNGDFSEINVYVTNPAANQYAIQNFTVSMPTGWAVDGCYEDGTYFTTCHDSGQTFTYGAYLQPGATGYVGLEIDSPANTVSTQYPYSVTFTTTVQDQSSPAYYAGPSLTYQVIASTSAIAITPTLTSPYIAGSSPYSLTATVTCTGQGCSSGKEAGVQFNFQVWNTTAGAATSAGLTTVQGTSSATGTLTTTWQPSNHAGVQGYVYASFGPAPGECTWEYGCFSASTATITTNPGAPSSVGFTYGPGKFGATEYQVTSATSVGTSGSYPTGYNGAVLCNVAAAGCVAGQVTAQKVGISVTDKFGNAISFAGITYGAGQGVTLQTASGAVFDAAGLPSTIGPYTPAVPFTVPDNYFQSSTYATAGVITATITGVYNAAGFSVSGSSGTIQTSTYAGAVNFQTTHEVNPFPAANVAAGKSYTFQVALTTVQTGVPVSVGVCPHATCAGTTSKYSGTVNVVSGFTNSSGIFSTTLNVDTVAGHLAYVEANVTAPTNALPKNVFTDTSANAITTISGSAAKFSVVVGPTAAIDQSITNSIPGATVYVNVVTSDAFGNPVLTASSQQVQISLVANPNTITASSVYIPTGCAATNATGSGTVTHYTCTGVIGSFGAIAWTLPNTVGGTATISASGVLNGAVVTAATVTINLVSKLPTISVFSPKPLAGFIYSNSANVQFRGWANASIGYNGAVTMSTVAWKIGSGSWQSAGIAGTNSQWSVIATLPSGLSTVTFNATDSKGNVAVSNTYSVLVDTGAPVITNVTPAGAVLNPGQLFQATIVDSQGDLNATSVGVTYNGTALAVSAIAVTGTNNPGSSVTYTVTAALPTSVGNPGHWSVAVSASNLAGNSATGPNVLLTVTVAFGDSITFNTAGATYGAVGAYKGVTISVTNSWSTSQTIVVFATIKSGTSIYVAQGTVTVAAGATASVFTADLQTVPAGTYTVTFSAVTTTNAAVSAPTTAITVTAT